MNKYLIFLAIWFYTAPFVMFCQASDRLYIPYDHSNEQTTSRHSEFVRFQDTARQDRALRDLYDHDNHKSLNYGKERDKQK